MRSVSLPFVPAASVFPEGESAAEEEDAEETPSQRGWVEIPSIRFAEAGLVWSDGLHGAAEVTIADPPGGEMGREPAGTLSPIMQEAKPAPLGGEPGAVVTRARSYERRRRNLLRVVAVVIGVLLGGGVTYLTARSLLAAGTQSVEIAAARGQGASPPSVVPGTASAVIDAGKPLLAPDAGSEQRTAVQGARETL
jgi:hypothetical protein